MTPLDLLREEWTNVKRALDETLRYDYGPEQGREYYTECDSRLREIETAISSISANDLQTIRARSDELLQLSSWILLIERSHLGEFSWPFSDEVKEIANQLLSERNLKGDLVKPLIHVVAEGEGYQIIYEPQTATASSQRPFVVVAFQRSLKYHALFHAIFGHELCHTALQTPTAGGVLAKEVVGSFISSGPMVSSVTFNGWLNRADGQLLLADALKKYSMLPGNIRLSDDDRLSWLVELTCDLFGLVLFGPAFLAAHLTLLRHIRPDPYEFHLPGTTHPPYSVRHKMLRKAMELLGWHKPITRMEAELEFLNFLLDDPYAQWAMLFNDNQLKQAIAGIQNVIDPVKHLAYSPVGAEALAALVSCLEDQRPPIVAGLSADGRPEVTMVSIAQTLYAGWAYWIGKGKLPSARPLDFFETNRLCDLALLQQRAINDAIREGIC